MTTSRHTIAALLLPLLLLAGDGRAQTAPDRVDVVRAVTAADPARFACAHTGRPCEADWIKAVAWALHQTDPAWGLNMKRDNDAAGLSLDVVVYRVGPTNRHVVAFDVCGQCGAPTASVVWQDITDRRPAGPGVLGWGNPGTARWVRPEPVAGTGGGGGGGTGGGGGGGVVTPPAVDLTPVLERLAALSARLEALAAEVAAGLAASAAARDAAASAALDAKDLARVLIHDPPPPPAAPCLVGRVPKTFSGSAEVRLCPAGQ